MKNYLKISLLLTPFLFLFSCTPKEKMETGDYFGEDHPGISAITTHLC
jgi:hypothetical protein